MKRLGTLVVSFALAGTVAFAHGTNDHVRGVVTVITPTSVTVETTDKATKTLALTAKTTFQKGGRVARLLDLKVGDRVVIDVPAKTSDALVIQIGTAQPPPAPKLTTLNGAIGDSLCGPQHHPDMAAGPCTDSCIKTGGSYVFVSNGKVYKLAATVKAVSPFGGQAVSLTGELQGDTIKVSRIVKAGASKG